MNKKTIIFISIFIFLLISVLIVSSSSDEDKTKVNAEVHEELENNETVAVIIKLKSNENNLENQKEIIKENIENKETGETKNLISAEISKKELGELKQNKDIEKISISHPIKAFLQDSVPLINASVTWALQTSGINITGTSETICVIDTGINFTHPDLIGKNKTCVIDCYNKACVENCSVHDDNGHGTHVAGIVAASGSINGVAIGADLIGVKVLDLNGNGHATNAEVDLVNAIDWCVLNRNLYNISTITMSLGTSVLNKTACDSTFTNTWTKSINNATLMNISIIAATGNLGLGILRNTTAIAAPACITNATSVSATDKDDSISSYGHYNSLTDFFAPGTNINSTYNGGYAVQDGTSMATPHVAGVFALFWQFFRLQNSRVPTPQEIINNLNSSSKKINTGGYKISRIDIYSAIDEITKSVTVIFESPADNFSTKQDENNFTCNSTSKNYLLTNISFYLWNSTNNLIYNLTTNITGNNNLSVFNYTFSTEDNYLWNCVSYNNQSYLNSNSNFTINYDITTTNISSVSSGSITTTSSIITWTTNENANSSVNYGTTNNLGGIVSNSSLATSHSIPLSSLSSSTIYYYNVTSCDATNNCNTTGTNSFTTSTPTPVTSSGNPGGGGSSITTTTYVATPEQASAGYNQTLKINDKIKFTFFDTNSEQHFLTITKLETSFIDILIQSEPIKLSLGIGQSAKLNLTSAVYYDLYVKLDSIKNNKAEITIQTIHEEIPKPVLITGGVIKNIVEQTDETPEKNIKDLEFKITKLETIIRIIIVIFIIVIIFLLFRERIVKTNIKIKKRQEHIKEHKKKFKEIKPKRKKWKH